MKRDANPSGVLFFFLLQSFLPLRTTLLFIYRHCEEKRRSAAFLPKQSIVGF
jgi:hypothetical protein